MGRHSAAYLATLTWSPHTPVKAFRNLDAANAWVRSVRSYWLALTWPAPQILSWRVVDARDGTITTSTNPSPKEKAHGTQGEQSYRLF